MTCFSNGTLTVCQPTIQEVKKWRRICRSCTFRATFLGWHQEWYGWHVTCLNCGEVWQDGEWGERPFERGWRQQNIAAARRVWKRHQASARGGP